ncbi:MAG: hypothetical protein JNM93_05805 [Bacteriovoracaceae bacterium]|nr:hypothetical protein [Bacteriovoracaceae bacterium]
MSCLTTLRTLVKTLVLSLLLIANSYAQTIETAETTNTPRKNPLELIDDVVGYYSTNFSEENVILDKILSVLKLRHPAKVPEHFFHFRELYRLNPLVQKDLLQDFLQYLQLPEHKGQLSSMHTLLNSTYLADVNKYDELEAFFNENVQPVEIRDAFSALENYYRNDLKKLADEREQRKLLEEIVRDMNKADAYHITNLSGFFINETHISPQEVQGTLQMLYDFALDNYFEELEKIGSDYIDEYDESRSYEPKDIGQKIERSAFEYFFDKDFKIINKEHIERGLVHDWAYKVKLTVINKKIVAKAKIGGNNVGENRNSYLITPPDLDLESKHFKQYLSRILIEDGARENFYLPSVELQRIAVLQAEITELEKTGADATMIQMRKDEIKLLTKEVNRFVELLKKQKASLKNVFSQRGASAVICQTNERGIIQEQVLVRKRPDYLSKDWFSHYFRAKYVKPTAHLLGLGIASSFVETSLYYLISNVIMGNEFRPEVLALIAGFSATFGTFQPFVRNLTYTGTEAHQTFKMLITSSLPYAYAMAALNHADLTSFWVEMNIMFSLIGNNISKITWKQYNYIRKLARKNTAELTFFGKKLKKVKVADRDETIVSQFPRQAKNIALTMTNAENVDVPGWLQRLPLSHDFMQQGLSTVVIMANYLGIRQLGTIFSYYGAKASLKDMGDMLPTKAKKSLNELEKTNVIRFIESAKKQVVSATEHAKEVTLSLTAALDKTMESVKKIPSKMVVLKLEKMEVRDLKEIDCDDLLR